MIRETHEVCEQPTELVPICVSDAVLKKAFSSPSFSTFHFISSLLIMLGLLKVRTGCLLVSYTVHS